MDSEVERRLDQWRRSGHHQMAPDRTVSSHRRWGGRERAEDTGESGNDRGSASVKPSAAPPDLGAHPPANSPPPCAL